MYWLIIFSFLYIVKKYLINNERLGLDERIVFIPDNVTFEKMFKIYETTEKIAFLESNNVSLDDKLYDIGNRNMPEQYVVFNGGLFNDWNFDFDVNE